MGYPIMAEVATWARNQILYRQRYTFLNYFSEIFLKWA